MAWHTITLDHFDIIFRPHSSLNFHFVPTRCRTTCFVYFKYERWIFDRSGMTGKLTLFLYLFVLSYVCTLRTHIIMPPYDIYLRTRVPMSELWIPNYMASLSDFPSKEAPRTQSFELLFWCVCAVLLLLLTHLTHWLLKVTAKPLHSSSRTNRFIACIASTE